MWVNLFFLVSAVSLLLLLFSFGALLVACCCRSKKSVASSAESQSIEMVPSQVAQSSDDEVSQNPFDQQSPAAPGKNAVDDASSESSDRPFNNSSAGGVSPPSTNPFHVSGSPSNNPFVRNAFDDDSVSDGGVDNASVNESSINGPSHNNPFSDQSINGQSINGQSINDPSINQSNNDPSINNPSINNQSNNNPFNHPINNPPTNPPTIPAKPAGLAALMGLADTSFSPALPPKPSQAFSPQRDETPARPERPPPSLADAPLSRPHRPAPILDNVETAPPLPPKPMKPPKPTKLLHRASTTGVRYIPCPEWMALTAEEKQTEETFLTRLSHRNIAKVGMMESQHVVCRVREEGRKGLHGGGGQRTATRNVPCTEHGR